MSDLSFSIEDNIVKKLKLNELQKEEQVKALLNYFQAIMEEKEKSSPPELKGLLNLMYEKLKDDTAASINKYISANNPIIQQFFAKNMQKFDQFEFKPYFLKMKGELPSQAYKVPIYDRRNFEQITPLDIKPYADILEADPLLLQINKNKAVKTDLAHVQSEKQADSKKIEEQLWALQKQIKSNIEKGVLSKDRVKEDIRFAGEYCIPALQIKYNTQAVNELTEIFLESAEKKDINQIMESLKMPFKQRERFCQILSKKAGLQIA